MPMHTVRVLLIDAPATTLAPLRDALDNQSPYTIALDTTASLTDACAALTQSRYDVLFVGLPQPDATAGQALRRLHDAAPEAALVAVGSDTNADERADALAQGAQLYLPRADLDAHHLPAIAARAYTAHHTGRIANLQQALARAEQERALLQEASDRLSQTLDLTTLYDTVRHIVIQLMDCNGLFISDYDAATDLIHCAYAWGEDAPLDISQLPPIPLEPAGHGTQSRVIRTGEALYLPDFQAALANTKTHYDVSQDGTLNDPATCPDDEDIVQSALIVPLKLQGTVSGVLQVFSYLRDAYTARDLHLLETLGPQIAVAQANARLYVQLQQELAEHRRTEAARRQEHTLLRALIDNVPDYIYVKDADSRFLLANVALAQSLGVDDPAGMIGKTDFDFSPPELARAYFEEEQDVLRTGQAIINRETYGVDHTGTPTWTLATRVPVHGPDGSAAQIVGISRDVTARKRAQDAEHHARVLAEALAETAATLNSTLHLDAVLDCILKAVGRVLPHTGANIMLVEQNAQMVRVVDVCPCYDRNGHAPPVTNTLFTLDERPLLRRAIQDRLPCVVSDTRQNDRWVASDTGQWVAAYICAPIMIDGNVTGFLNVDSDTVGAFDTEDAARLMAFADQAAVAIRNAQLYQSLETTNKNLEQLVEARTRELSRSTERVELILNSFDDALLTTLADGRIEQVNPAFEQQTGYTVTEVEMRNWTTLLVDHTTPHSMRTDLRAALAEGRPWRGEIVMRRKDATTYAADLVLAPMRNVPSEMKSSVLSIRDITARKESEETLRQALLREIETSSLKTRFLSMASHDLRTPLSVIQSSAELLTLYESQLSEERRSKALRRIQASVGNMVTLLDDILTVGRAEAGKLQFKPHPINITDFCRDLLQEFEATIGMEHSFQSTLECEFPFVVMDPKLVRHMLSNLLSNAIKYSPAGSTIRFHVRCQDDRAEFMVSDEGIGIPADDQQRLFQAFHRAGNVGNIPGTGLGLMIVMQAVTLHGGTLSFESEEGSGTTFTLTVPFGAKEARDE